MGAAEATAFFASLLCNQAKTKHPDELSALAHIGRGLPFFF
jgi:hypothetical protein